uniref:Ricin B-type lectin domain-containing protein n=1 Tax=Heterorhabditis bacteriophora TaxID=37862 RepID=A0A1I7WW96_HETBA
MLFRTLLLTTLASSTVSWNSEQAARSRYNLVRSLLRLFYEMGVVTKDSECWSSGNGQSARWWNEGEKIDRGKFWYECQRGVLAPMGCFTEKSERLDIGGSYENGGYISMCDLGKSKKTSEDVAYVNNSRYECQQKYNGSVQLCSVGCIHQGAHYKVGEQWPIRSDSFGHKPVGCLSKDSDGSAIERVIGCQKQLLTRYLQTYDSKVEQTCELDGNKTVVKTVGCIYRYKVRFFRKLFFLKELFRIEVF